MNTSSRLLDLLALLQTRSTWSGPELSARLGVTDRTLRRDIERLRDLGYEIEATSGPGGGYQFGAGHALPPLLFAEDEAVTLTVALRAAAEGGDGERALAVLAKVDRLLPQRLRERVAAVHSQTVQIGAPGVRVDGRVLTQLAAACRSSEAARIRYVPVCGDAGERTVVPLRLAHAGNGRWYLVAYDPAREGWRTLRVDRIAALLSVGPRVVRPEPPPDLEQYVSDAIANAPYPCRGTFELEGALDALRDRIPPWVGVLRADGEGRCLLEVGGPDWTSVLTFALSADVPFRVVGPPELAAEARRIAARIADAT